MMKKLIPILIIFTTILIQCQNMNKENVDVSEATIKVDSCDLSYKGQKLKLGVPISEWEKILGKPTRFIETVQKGQGQYIWDDKGVAVDNFQNENGDVAWAYIFFLNLDSPEANEQMLNHARDWESGEHVAARNMEGNKSLISEEVIKEINEKNKSRRGNYIYPFKVYKGVINLQGYPVKKGMKIEEINKYREKLPGEYTKFGYVDQDIDGVNDSGVTTKTFGGDYRAPGYECNDGRLQYFELTYTATGSLEYLKIGYESEEEHQDRKESDRFKKKEYGIRK